MTTETLTGFVVRETAAAVAFVESAHRAIAGVKPLWVPRKKIAQLVELDALSARIETAQDGTRNGVPVTLEIDAAFLEKVR